VIAKTAVEARYGYTGLIYAVTGYTTDKCRKIIHLHPLNGSIPVNVAFCDADLSVIAQQYYAYYCA
jgi:hypothetical protein